MIDETSWYGYHPWQSSSLPHNLHCRARRGRALTGVDNLEWLKSSTHQTWQHQPKIVIDVLYVRTNNILLFLKTFISDTLLWSLNAESKDKYTKRQVLHNYNITTTLSLSFKYNNIISSNYKKWSSTCDIFMSSIILLTFFITWNVLLKLQQISIFRSMRLRTSCTTFGWSVRPCARKIWITYIQAYMPYESWKDSSNQPYGPMGSLGCPLDPLGPPATPQSTPSDP